MALSSFERRILSPPVSVHWGGWETTTTRMQQCGWELSARQDMVRGSVALAFRHQGLRMRGVTDPVAFRYWGDPYASGQAANSIIFNVRYMASEIEVLRMNDIGLAEFQPIDAYPQLQEIRSIDDFGIFATPLARTEEIIVDPNDVAALLERIKAVQAPEQAAIRERARLRERRDRGAQWDAGPRQVFHAQILSFAKAA